MGEKIASQAMDTDTLRHQSGAKTSGPTPDLNRKHRLLRIRGVSKDDG